MNYMKNGLLLTATLALLLVGCGTDDSSGSVTKDVPTGTVDETTDNSEDFADYTFMNEEVVVDDVSYMVTGLAAGQEVAGYVSESGAYLAVTIQVKNNSKKAVDLSNNDFKIYSDEALYEHDPTTTRYHDKGFLFEKLNPGMSVTASVVYEVPLFVLEST